MTAGALPEYRIKARNTSTQSENAIHHDDVARSYGFAGGLVPGVTVYAYVTHPLVAAWGPDWLERGTASKDFITQVEAGYYHNSRRLVRASCRRVRAVFHCDSDKNGVNGRDAQRTIGCLHTMVSARCPRGMR